MFKQNLQPEKPEEQSEAEQEITSTVKSIALFIWDLGKIFATAFVLVWLIIRPFIAEPFVVSGNSMVPNFHNKEYLIVQKITYRLHVPERGDIIVFRYPLDNDQYFIKRIVGLPGDRVTIDKGRVTITNKENPNGFVLDEKYLPNQNVTIGRPDPVSVDDKHFYVLGDNRLQSSDSRAWGLLPKSDMVGKVFLRVLPLNLFGIIQHSSNIE